MRSARTDVPPEPMIGRVRRQLAWFQQLNARLVLALASVALVALLVSGAALTQVLPGYFVEQAISRARTSLRQAKIWAGELGRSRASIA